MGIQDSWQPSIASVSTNHPYQLSSAWSPYGQVFAIASEEAVEIRDALSLKLLSTLQLPEGETRFTQGLAYSPDGCFLAGCSNAAIIIWDVQTGGAVKKIELEVSGDCLQLVWSLNGEKIAVLLQVAGPLAVHIYQVASGAIQLSSPAQSALYAQLWAHNESFRMMVMAREKIDADKIVSTFEVGPALVKIKSITFQSGYNLISVFSHTGRIAAFAGSNKLLILDIHNSRVLLQVTVALYVNCCFSPDGSLFLVSTKNCFIIWKYASGHYTQWRKFEQGELVFQFSLTSSSILGKAGAILHIFHLDYSPTILSPESVTDIQSQQLDAFSLSGTYIATAHQHGSVITITNLHSQSPLPFQFIDTGVGILAMVLTGNVLLVKSPEEIISWLLTEEGVVNGIVNNRRANQNDSLWRRSLQSYTSFFARITGLEDQSSNDDITTFIVEDGVAVVMHNGDTLSVYHTQTGDMLGQDEEPQGKLYYLHSPHRKNGSHLYRCDSVNKHSRSIEGNWLITHATLQEGWIKDPGGKCQLWLHPSWRSSKNEVEWLYNASTLRLRTSSQLIIVKF